MSDISWLKHKQIQDYPWWVRLLLRGQMKKYGTPLFPTLYWGRSPMALLLFTLFFKFFERRKSPLEPALRSLIMVRISQVNWCSFCVDMNSLFLLERAQAIHKLEDLHSWPTSTHFSEKEKAALAYAEAVTRPDQSVPIDIRENLKQYFSEDEIVELTALIGYQNLSSKFNYALSIPAQGLCEMRTAPLPITDEEPQG
ncbi:MAG: carboxymuconolactone decarboxylase family protein [Bdellovibrionaceae bacterium]|nr:carboxymuconolactone decarboxylase family protein [Bdellovibrionales bacterium]MCB9085093.1 carboxymuconolactone decarboxylase family protein [Pseudobdellovibrionaceae bacterium]